MPRSSRANSPSIYSEYLLSVSSFVFFRSRLPGWPMPLLFWAGGTYARRPEDFPQEQSSAAWLEEFLLPLKMRAPGIRSIQTCGYCSDLAKTWSSAKWHGKAPHPYAIREPFPYASASMRKYYCDAKIQTLPYTDAKDVCRDSPWSNLQR